MRKTRQPNYLWTVPLVRTTPVPVLLFALKVAVRMRNQYLKPALALNNQMNALERCAAKQAHLKKQKKGKKYVISPELREASIAVLKQTELADAHGLLDKKVEELKLGIQRATRLLPIWTAWAKDLKGIAPLGLGNVIGETGDLWNYSKPSKVFKRMGLGVTDGKADRRMKGVDNGFNPRRRAVMKIAAKGFVIQKANPGQYRRLYDERMALGKEYGNTHAHRYVAKRFLRDLWVEWRKVMPQVEIPLSSEAQQTIAQAVEHPPEPSQELRKAAKRFSENGAS